MSGCRFQLVIVKTPLAPPLRYEDAARIRDEAKTGLIGWWAGRGENDPYGHLLHVSPGFGCYIGRAYLPKSLFEIKASTCRENAISTAESKRQSVSLHVFCCMCRWPLAATPGAPTCPSRCSAHPCESLFEIKANTCTVTPQLHCLSHSLHLSWRFILLRHCGDTRSVRCLLSRKQECGSFEQPAEIAPFMHLSVSILCMQQEHVSLGAAGGRHGLTAARV